MGYGRYGTMLAREIRKQGVTVYDDLPSPPGHTQIVNPAVVEEVPDDRCTGKANVACWVSVPSHAMGWWKDQIPAIATMWESHRLPESFHSTLPNFDTVIVPSWHNVELFSEYHDNVKFVPLGVDPEVWHYVPRQEPKQFFNFLIGGSGSRKGTDLAVDAFCKVFGKEGSWGSGPIPVLQMKNPKGEQFYGAGGRIHTIAGRLDDQAEVDLYAQAHCYLQPSRGEGFGLQPLQAMAQGIPTILTNAHGHESFAHLGLGISAGLSDADYFIFGDAGKWWEPSFDELCERMRAVYDDYDEYVTLAESAAAHIARDWTWERSASKFLDALGRDRLTPYTGSDEWFKAQVKLFKTITRQERHMEIANQTFHFRPGVEYWAPADVKRILFEAGMLHPDCLDDSDPESSGLTEVQIAKLDKVLAKSQT
jgi:glycosyltransferase involved in cell wall biosynthesis